MVTKKYTATLHETCSFGYAYEAHGNTLSEVRKNTIEKFMNSRWHKTADPPVIRIRENNSTPYGKPIGEITVSKQYSPTTPYLFYWRIADGSGRGSRATGRLIKSNGELGLTYEGYKKKKYKDLVGKYPYW